MTKWAVATFTCTGVLMYIHGYDEYIHTLVHTTELWFTGNPLGTDVVQQHVSSLSRSLEPSGQVVEKVTHLLGDDLIIDLGASLHSGQTVHNVDPCNLT